MKLEPSVATGCVDGSTPMALALALALNAVGLEVLSRRPGGEAHHDESETSRSRLKRTVP